MSALLTGMRAYKAGVARTENPFSRTEQENEFHDWDFGWAEARENARIADVPVAVQPLI